jgi:hypothetical protein
MLASQHLPPKLKVTHARLWTARQGTEAIQSFYCFRFGGSSHIWCVIFHAPVGSLRINVRTYRSC